ncbi:hypothetical protein D3C86_1929210 [compost metagenome]
MIEHGSSFVQHNYLGIGQQYPGHRQPLLLSAGQLYAFFTNDRLVFQGELFDEFTHVCHAASFLYFLIRCLRPGQLYVVEDRHVEDSRVLHDHSNMTVQLRFVHFRYISAR